VDKTGCSHKKPDENYIKDTSTSEFSWQGLSMMWEQCVDRHYHATLHHLSSAFGSNNCFKLVLKHFTIMDAVCCCASLLVVFQDSPVHPKKSVKITFLADGLVINSFLLAVSVVSVQVFAF
jgi:hypothetical protein